MSFLFSRQHSTRIQLFQNKWLEASTLTPFPLFFTVWTLIDLISLFTAFKNNGFLDTFLGFAFGLCVWVIFEYCAHRYIFHLNLKSAFGKHFIFLLHGNHHSDPKDPLRSIMPLTVSLPLGFLIWEALRYLSLPAYSAVFSGFIVGYTAYDSTHWACHQISSTNKIVRKLRKHHMLHHYAKVHGNYATTLPLVDRVFKTFIRPR
ncbi:fatty acid hydroxylase [Neokomagataea tanensis]|uniref:Fatty acid hydroxylase n=1 Tax=Neokomagataea tanensis TaxID=661191 RepID=A0A4Y6V3E2_9PROT|nr:MULTISPECIES: sterol desaturase family protein [Neokomagataea]QDH24622.1 fatty acid hydroxylase [Neokomagataea tanensis]